VRLYSPKSERFVSIPPGTICKLLDVIDWLTVSRLKLGAITVVALKPI